ncbi:Protein yif1b [Dermatophagoides farinae]|uniref:Protein YIF1 n=1 Tax=Dermatophagoides farinae TaxID=6954 RepID=A0A922HZV4_DERFA|nr:Protein yif1b [Dermatophagoides farinae]
MDLNRPGPSRRHISSGTDNVSSTPMFTESYFTVDSDNFDQTAAKTSSSSPPVPPSTQGFNNYNQMNSFFNQNDNYGISSPTPPVSCSSSWQQPPSMPPMSGFSSGQIPQQQFHQPMFPNQQFLMAAGQQLLSNPMTAAAIDAYSQSLVDKSKGWMGNIKQYFAVDTNYAMKKLLLIFAPFLHKDWSIRYNSEIVAPRDEPNLPDLYIPSMAFITYILVSGYILGLRNQFAPEQLGIYASSALAWLLLEVFLIMIAKYVMNLSSALGFFHMVAFRIDTLLLAAIMFGRNGYLILFMYCTVSLGYFLIRALSTNLQQSQQSSYQHQYGDNPRTAYYLVIFIALLQPFIMYFLTSSLSTTIHDPSGSTIPSKPIE